MAETEAPVSTSDQVRSSTPEPRDFPLGDFRQEASAFNNFAAQFVPAWQKAQDEKRALLQSQGKRLDALSDDITQFGIDRAKQGQPPEPPTEGPTPNISLRPFGEISPGDSTSQMLQKTLMQLGLMAQMGVGLAKGHPQGALAAYSGALDGWAKGDRARAEMDWQEYLAQVQKMQREWQRQALKFAMIQRQFEGKGDQLRLQMGMEAARQGWEDKLVQQAFEQPDMVMKMFGLQAQVIHDIAQGTMKAEQMRRAEDWKQKEFAESTRQFNAKMAEDIRHHNILESQKGQQQKEKDLKHDAQVNVMQVALNQMRALAPEMERKGFFQKQVGLGSAANAWLERARQKGDPTLAQWEQHAQTVVGFDRSIMNDLGRAQSAYAAGQAFIHNPPTREGANAVINRFQELLDAERAGRTGQQTPPNYNAGDTLPPVSVKGQGDAAPSGFTWK